MRGVSWMLVAAAIVMSASCTPAPDAERAGDTGTPAAASAMTDYLDGLVRTRLFRGAVEVRRGNDVVLRKGFDRADIRSGVPNGPRTRFRLASVTKQFTALAVLMLQEKHLLRVEDRVCVHLPSCPPAWREITVEQLLTHTSGLFDYNDLSQAEIARHLRELGDTPTPDQLITVFAGRPLYFRPGTRWDYSNCGYDLLGLLVERLSGRPYGQFLREEVLDPLGMADSGYDPEGRADSGEEPYAVGYARWTDKADTLPDAVNYASGGMYATADDMIRWDRFLLTGKPAIVSPATRAELLRPRVATDRPGESYGYGILTTGSGNNLVHHHSGSIAGFTTYTAIHPATDLAITVLGNLATGDAPRIGTTLAHMATTN